MFIPLESRESLTHCVQCQWRRSSEIESGKIKQKKESRSVNEERQKNAWVRVKVSMPSLRLEMRQHSGIGQSRHKK